MTTFTTAAAEGAPLGRPARPGGAAYWERVRRIVDTAPPLSVEQRAAIRMAIHGTGRPGQVAAA